MLIEESSHLYTYVIARDFGFAPNPFHGYCTLATCKPGIRKAATVGDWILGVGGKKLGTAYRKCILLMKVSEKMGFQSYWEDERFSLKKPCRNGTQVKMLGDNIYHKSPDNEWIQEDSHHSNADGTPNTGNLKRDTGSSDQVLISKDFFYFGNSAISVDLASIEYVSGLGFKKTCLSSSQAGRDLIYSVYSKNRRNLGYVVSDPCQFDSSHKRVDQETGKLS